MVNVPKAYPDMCVGKPPICTNKSVKSDVFNHDFPHCFCLLGDLLNIDDFEMIVQKEIAGIYRMEVRWQLIS